MKLIDQCCTLSQAKRLKELGVCQRVNIYHDIRHDEPDIFMPSYWTFRKKGTPQKQKEATDDLMGKGLIVAAFTVAELSVMLPDYYPSWRFKVSESSEERKWVVTLICSPKPPGVDDIHTESSFDRYGKTQAEALATLLIALLETEAITVEEVNARLCENQ